MLTELALAVDDRGGTYRERVRLGGDRVAAEDILNLLGRLNHELGKTIILVTHDPHAAEKAHIIRHLEKGVLDAAEVTG